MPSNPLTDKEIYELSLKKQLPSKRFFATNPTNPSSMGYYDIDTYITGLGYIKSTPTLTATWIQLVTGYKVGTIPTFLATIVTGDVYSYTFETDTTDVIYYRHIGVTEDAFYENFDGTNLTDFIVKKETLI